MELRSVDTLANKCLLTILGMCSLGNQQSFKRSLLQNIWRVSFGGDPGDIYVEGETMAVVVNKISRLEIIRDYFKEDGSIKPTCFYKGVGKFCLVCKKCVENNHEHVLEEMSDDAWRYLIIYSFFFNASHEDSKVETMELRLGKYIEKITLTV